MKILTTLCVLALATSAQAQTFNIADWTVQTYTANTTVKGLTVLATADKTVTVAASNKSLDDFSFTQCMKLGGSGAVNARCLTFDVTGNTQIDVYATSANSTATRELAIATGSFDNVVSTTTLNGSTLGKASFTYKGDATKVWVYSKSSGINIYGINLSAVADGGNDNSNTGGNSGNSGNTGTGLSAYDAGAPIGWASANGYACVGSQDVNPVTVTTLNELTTALRTAYNNTKSQGKANMTIYIKGVIEMSAPIKIQDTKGLTVYGLPGSALVNNYRDKAANGQATGIINFKRNQNVILRNVTFKSAGAYDIDGNDNLTIEESTNCWFDHCDFQDGVDGNADFKNASDNISFTWCRFRYLIAPKAGGSGGSNDHRFSNLIGASDNEPDDVGKLRITFANCWWDEGCRERQPRVRYGKIHLVNCLFSSSVTNYCIGVGYKAQIYAENCVFNNKGKNWTYASSTGQNDHSLILKGCINQADMQEKVVEDYFNPADNYTLQAYDAANVEAAVSNAQSGAGATLAIEEGKPFTTGIDAVAQEGGQTAFFNLQGMAEPSLQKGINIVKTTTTDGRTVVRKVVKQ